MQDLKREVIAKYAEKATNLLQQYYPNDFTAATIEKLACALIETDLALAEKLELQEHKKQASYIMATSFLEELVSLSDKGKL